MQVAHMEKSLELSKKTAAESYGLNFTVWILRPFGAQDDECASLRRV